MMEILEECFGYVARTGTGRLPGAFDYKYFYAGVKHILQSDHSFMVARCLSLLYKHYPIFSPQFRKDLSMTLMGLLFFKLYLSWASNIRMMFHHLLIYRINLDIL